jgi:hypothetical protein
VTRNDREVAGLGAMVFNPARTKPGTSSRKQRLTTTDNVETM